VLQTCVSLLPVSCLDDLLPLLALQPYGLSCAENVAKECWEEAGVPQELAAAAVPVGCVSYVSMSEEGLKPDVLFCYDLQLPDDFVPQPQDGEVRGCAACAVVNGVLSTHRLGGAVG
jgi:8-oxo-dGTP pyrophosphatase MutT (NUDIX family)